MAMEWPVVRSDCRNRIVDGIGFPNFPLGAAGEWDQIVSPKFLHGLCHDCVFQCARMWRGWAKLHPGLQIPAIDHESGARLEQG